MMLSGQEAHPVLDRRTFIGAVLAGGGLVAAGHARAMAVENPAAGRLAFDIRRDGASIGAHQVSFRRAGDDLLVDIEVDIVVSFAFIPVFAYRHWNRETWRGGRLIALDSETDDDGRHYAVSARASEGGLRVTGSEGDLLVPPDILPTSYWNARTVQQTRLLDSQQGRLLEVKPKLVGEAALDSNVMARHYRISGDLDLDLWYSPSGEWLKTAFQARGAAVSYARLDRGVKAGSAG